MLSNIVINLIVLGAIIEFCWWLHGKFIFISTECVILQQSYVLERFLRKSCQQLLKGLKKWPPDSIEYIQALSSYQGHSIAELFNQLLAPNSEVLVLNGVQLATSFLRQDLAIEKCVADQACTLVWPKKVKVTIKHKLVIYDDLQVAEFKIIDVIDTAKARFITIQPLFSPLIGNYTFKKNFARAKVIECMTFYQARMPYEQFFSLYYRSPAMQHPLALLDRVNTFNVKLIPQKIGYLLEVLINFSPVNMHVTKNINFTIYVPPI